MKPLLWLNVVRHVSQTKVCSKCCKLSLAKLVNIFSPSQPYWSDLQHILMETPKFCNDSQTAAADAWKTIKISTSCRQLFSAHPKIKLKDAKRWQRWAGGCVAAKICCPPINSVFSKSSSQAKRGMVGVLVPTPGLPPPPSSAGHHFYLPLMLLHTNLWPIIRKVCNMLDYSSRLDTTAIYH